MANLTQSTITIPSAGGRMDLNFFQFGTHTVGATHLHLKTNIARYSSVMYMIEAVGYSYDRTQSIQCAFTGYMYHLVPTTIHNPTQFQAAPGLVADGQYLSSDNFLVLRFSSTAAAYAAFVLNCYQMNPVGKVNPQVTAVLHNTNAGAAF